MNCKRHENSQELVVCRECYDYSREYAKMEAESLAVATADKLELKEQLRLKELQLQEAKKKSGQLEHTLNETRHKLHLDHCRHCKCACKDCI